MEFQRFLPLVHDDIPDTLWRVDRTSLGLHEGGTSQWSRKLFLRIPTRTCYGKLHGAQPLPCLAT